jgi:hypothetical protein
MQKLCKGCPELFFLYLSVFIYNDKFKPACPFLDNTHQKRQKMPKARISASRGIYRALRRIPELKSFGLRRSVSQLHQINAANDQFI